LKTLIWIKRKFKVSKEIQITKAEKNYKFKNLNSKKILIYKFKIITYCLQ